jgi:hypothetical protein
MCFFLTSTFIERFSKIARFHRPLFGIKQLHSDRSPLFGLERSCLRTIVQPVVQPSAELASDKSAFLVREKFVLSSYSCDPS